MSRGCCWLNPLPSTKTAVVAIARPSSRIHETRAPASPTKSARAKVHTLTPRKLPMTKEMPTPMADATVLWAPPGERTVDGGVHGQQCGPRREEGQR